MTMKRSFFVAVSVTSSFYRMRLLASSLLHWTPEGKRNRGRPKTTWRRTVEKELRKLNNNWRTIEKLAKDRQGWKDFVAALCATQA